MRRRITTRGFTLVEFLLALTLGALIVTTVGSLLAQLGATRAETEERLRLTRAAQFAMNRIVRSVRESRQLLLPQLNKPATDWRDNVREETVPASPPEGSSLKATAVLAVTLSAAYDLDADGFPDADNDRDGRIDEDYPGDITNDAAPGVRGIDDGGNGLVDEGIFANADDDERLNVANEDGIDGIDNDDDGAIDEDPGSDMNGDGAPGISGVDDDGDGVTDEGNAADDDEDGTEDEDWLDAVVYYLQGDALIERHPVPWDESGDATVSGRDFLLSTIADGVTSLRFERLAGTLRYDIVDISITVANADGMSVSLSTRARVGGAL